MKTFKLAEIRDLLDEVSNENITLSRFVEILNEKAGAKAAAKSDVNKDDMSKRFYAACMAMQGLLSNGRYDQRYYEGDSTSLICKRAYAIADELLKQESE